MKTLKVNMQRSLPSASITNDAGRGGKAPLECPVFQTAPPARLVTPGTILRRELQERGWDSKDLAEITGRPEQTISQIITARKRITEETALQLGRALGMEPTFWLSIESQYRLDLARREAGGQPDLIARRARHRELIPSMRELVKRGWLPDTSDIEIMEGAICQLLGIADIHQTPTLAIAERHRSRDEDAAVLQLELVWARRVEMLADERTLPAFSHDALEAAMPALMALARDAEGVAEVPDLLERLGVRFVICPNLEKVRMEGAVWPHRSTPVIALTLLHDRLDSFWFTLLRQLGHILLRHGGLRLAFEPPDAAMDDIEEQAVSDFASRWLRRSEAAPPGEPKPDAPSRRDVMQLAGQLGLHPCLVAGMLRSASGDHRLHRAFELKVRPLLSAWITP